MRRLLLNLALVLLAASHGSVAAAQTAAAPSVAESRVLPSEPIVEKLPNGLTLVVQKLPTPGVIAFYTLVRTGSRDEVEPGKSGFAHLFEHMMFRGSEKISAHEYEARTQKLGVDGNAYTTDDYTLYTITIPSGSLKELMGLEADRFMNLSFSQDVYKTETGAVAGEYRKSAADPSLKMEEALGEIAFTRHTYGHTTIGFLRDVEAMPKNYDYAKAFFKRFYTPDNCMVILAGDVDSASALGDLRSTYSAWKGTRAVSKVTKEPDQTGSRRRDLTWTAPTTKRLLVGYKIPAYSSANVEAAALEVIYRVLLHPSSDLYQRLVVKEQKLIALEGTSGWPHRDPHLFVAQAKLKDDATFDAIVATIDEELARIAEGKTDPARVKEVKRHIESGLVLDLQKPGEVAQNLAHFAMLEGDVRGLEKYVQNVRAVSPADVARVASAWLTKSKRNVVTMVGGDAKAAARPDAPTAEGKKKLATPPANAGPPPKVAPAPGTPAPKPAAAAKPESKKGEGR